MKNRTWSVLYWLYFPKTSQTYKHLFFVFCITMTDEMLTLMVVSGVMASRHEDGVAPLTALRREATPSCLTNLVPGGTIKFAWGGN